MPFTNFDITPNAYTHVTGPFDRIQNIIKNVYDKIVNFEYERRTARHADTVRVIVYIEFKIRINK